MDLQFVLYVQQLNFSCQSYCNRFYYTYIGNPFPLHATLVTLALVTLV